MEDIIIPKGYEAKIEGDKVVFVKKESEDEKIRKNIISYFDGMRDKNLPKGMKQPTLDAWIAYLERQKESQPKMIQWTGKNLKEVINFTGKSPKFDEWFKSWEDFENYVHSHGDIFKLFCEDGSHYEVPVGAWIIKTPDGFNTPSHFRFIQKPAEWSEKDERVILDAYCWLAEYAGFLMSENKDKAKMLWGLSEKLKSLRPQPKQEWNEEDEKMRVSIILTLASFMGNGEEISWFKSLPERFNPQVGLSKEDFVKFGNLEYERGKQDGIQSAERFHWKPSKEQLAALERSYRACYSDDICSLDDGYQLRELYNKLIEVQ